MADNIVVGVTDAGVKLNSSHGPSPLLSVIFLSYFTFGMITNVIGVIIPEVISQYHLSLFAAGLLAFGFFVAYGVCSIPAGLLTDRLGAKPLMLCGVTLMGMGCLGAAAAGSYPVLLGMVFAIGVGVTVLQTAGNPLVQHLDKPENYHRNLTLTIGFCGIGACAGPFTLAFILGMGRSWQTLYLAFAALCIALFALLVISSFPSRSVSADHFRSDQIGRLLRNPLLLAYALGIFLYVGAEVGTASWIVKFFDSVHGLAPQVAAPTSTSFLGKFFPTLPALIVALFWGAQGGGRLISGAVLHRFGSRGMLRTHAFLALASLLLADLGSRIVTAVGFVACGFFTSVLFTLLFSGAISSFADNHGTISGLLCTAIVGGALVPPMVGWLGDRWGMHVAMLAPAACFAYVFLLSVFGRARYEESHA